MKTETKTATLRVATRNPLVCRIEYEHLSDLLQSIAEILSGNHRDALITLPNGESYHVTQLIGRAAV
jgi:hypothetical protein